MKATQRDFAGAAQRAARQCRVFFFCGPDEAGASAAADRIVELLDDPGERVELAGAALRKDPVLLGDEARSSSLFGGARHIYVRATGDEAHDAVANLVQGTGDACPVLIVATSATDKSRTAKLLEKRDDALVAMFWPPDLPSVTASVRTMADAAGLRLNGDIAERIARAAGLDVRLARSEVEKLALYLDASPAAPRNADAEALEAIGATTEEDGFAALVNAVLGGEVRKIPAEIQRMRTLSLNPVGVLLAIERRAAQLARLAATLGGRRLGDLDRGAKARLGIFWKEERDIAAQLQRWRGRDLDRLVAKVVALHRALLANSQSAELLLAQGLAEIARHAARR
ncbi:DNA polymerase III subunit delta [Pelagerythrobacter marinus]|uniref:DNA polymerase III subunit delta n=1 Tax=Pelagerythrobacter marinus TaxID=538382 RepID=UPI0020371499|nr:DNA polymerase III subunit delta [Pelagerythrobacter marinus]USA39260.1 DNA polymerase III subunit delta [Pelagerythrobacter marinus]WPZ06653.1 DNA polymerase III subunit delta [Pelagerythrobacter marinus]